MYLNYNRNVYITAYMGVNSSWLWAIAIPSFSMNVVKSLFLITEAPSLSPP